MSAAAGANEGAAFIAAQGPVINLCGAIVHPHVINTRFYESQESLGCGRHALNNLLGGRYFQKEGDYNPDVLPISLQGLCRTMGVILRSRGVGETECPSSEFYDVTVLAAGLNVLGFKASQNIIRDSVYSRDDSYGFIVNKQQGAHWVALRKEGDRYRFIDSNNGAHAPGILKRQPGVLMTLDEFKRDNPLYIAFINVKKPAERVCINPLAYLDQRNVSDCPYSVNDVIAIDGVRYTVVNTEIDSYTGRCVSIYVTVDPRYGELSQQSSFLNIYFILTNIIKVYSPELVPFDKARITNSLYDKMGVKPPGASLGNRNKNTIVQNQYERKLLIIRCARAIMDGTAMPEGANRIDELTRDIHELTDRVWGEPSEMTIIKRDVENYEVRVIETVIASRARRAAAGAANAAAANAAAANAAAANAAAANAAAANAAGAARAATAARAANAAAAANAAVANEVNVDEVIAAAEAAAAARAANEANVDEAIAAAAAANAAEAARVANEANAANAAAAANAANAAARAANAAAIATARAANAAAIAAARARNNAAVRAAAGAAAIAASGAPDSVYRAKNPPPGYKKVMAAAGITNLPPGWILKQINNPDEPMRHGKYFFKHETAKVSEWTLNLPISGGRRRKTRRRRQTRKLRR